jgi:VanZ family protein
LGIVFYRCFSHSNRDEDSKLKVASLLGSAAVSICSELLQLYVPTRTPSLRDFSVDLAGAFLAIILLPWMQSAISLRQTQARTRQGSPKR